LTPNPIRKVLSTFRQHRVRALLMGGQACILYGAAEFSRDTDFAVLSDPQNLRRLRAALKALRAQPVFVPPLEARHLQRGHACHFRCHARGVERLCVDVMSVMRGCDGFPQLWKRRQAVRLTGLGTINVLSLPDLVAAKKTQRDKDWPMIRRLIEADYFGRSERSSPAQVRFWLREMRTPELLIELAARYPRQAAALRRARPLLQHAITGNAHRLQRALESEESAIRAEDRRYWQPLRRELSDLRRAASLP
jgi:hypothetical protein